MLHKESMLDLILVILLVIGCILVICLRVSNYAAGINDSIDDNQIVYHKHDHKGLACCPCGGCHIAKLDKPKYDDGCESDEEHAEHESHPRLFPFSIKLISVISTVALILSALHV